MATESLSYGGFHFSTPVATPTTANVPTKVLGTTTTTFVNNFTHSVNNRMSFNGIIERVFKVSAAISVSAGGATQTKFFIYKNGIKVVASEIDRKISTGGDIGAMSIGALINLTENDYVELWCETDDGDTLTVECGGLVTSVAG